MKVVGSRLRNDVDDCAGVAALLSFDVGEYRCFRDGSDWQNRRGRSENAGFVDCWQIAVRAGIIVLFFCAVSAYRCVSLRRSQF